LKIVGPKVITAPTEEPVTVAEAKAWCRVDGSDEDAIFVRLIAAAREHVEHLSDLSLIQQTLMVTLDDWPDDEKDQGIIELLRPPVTSITWIKYYNTAGAQVTWDATEYLVDLISEPARIKLAPNKSWPEVQDGLLAPISIQYVAGVATAAALKSVAKHAVLLLVSHWYENREAVLVGTISKEVEMGVRALVSQMWTGKLY
jgi:uncharacterized phiE125 gp8 family phage protein